MPVPDGPQDFYSTKRPPAPSQLRKIADLGCDLLDVVKPKNRQEASILIARMELAAGEDDSDKKTPTSADNTDIPF